MRIILSILMILNLVCQMQAQNLDDLEFGTNATFEIITWNLENFPRQGQTTVEYVAQAVKAMDADIIALQEIDNRTSFLQLVNHLDGWEGYYTNYQYGNLAYLYKSDVVEILDIFEIFTNEGLEFPRAPLVLELNYDGKFYAIINNHLKCCGDGLLDQIDPWDEETRRFGANYLLQQYIQSSYPNEKVIVLGDFNDVLTDNSNNNVFQPFLNFPDKYRFMDAAIASGSSAHWSYPSWPSHLDHILVSNELFSALDGENASTQTLKIEDYLPGGLWEYSNKISDHRPVGLKINPTLVGVAAAETTTWNFSVAPNPFRQSTQLSFDAVDADATLGIYNVNGQLVEQFLLAARQSSVVWKVDNLSAGIYYARLQTGNLVTIQKLVVQR